MQEMISLKQGVSYHRQWYLIEQHCHCCLFKFSLYLSNVFKTYLNEIIFVNFDFYFLSRNIRCIHYYYYYYYYQFFHEIRESAIYAHLNNFINLYLKIKYHFLYFKIYFGAIFAYIMIFEKISVRLIFSFTQINKPIFVNFLLTST